MKSSNWIAAHFDTSMNEAAAIPANLTNFTCEKLANAAICEWHGRLVSKKSGK
jgi:hypothetical protein